MIQIQARPSGPRFAEWSSRAALARDKLIRAWRAECEASVREQRTFDWIPKFDDSLYKEFRTVFLFEAFHKKCAYCEVKHDDGYPMQVEHYRPKAGVTVDRKPISHGGYFWLAYEWWNLVPSCAHCNTNHTDPGGGSHPGKKNEFPISGDRVCEPSGDPQQWCAELAAERATLLNPYFDDPEASIDFDTATGTAVPKCPRGKVTITVCDLNRPSLRDRRLKLRADALYTMMDRLRQLEDLGTIAPPEEELSVWRKRIVQDLLKRMNVCAHI